MILANHGIISSSGGALNPMLLDVYIGAEAAYSLRKLRTAYSGDAIIVRRSSDNTSQSIGFINNELDTTSLLSFVGSNNGFVTTWYDQSGNGRDLTQTTATDQPRIVNAGVLETLNGKPSIYNYGTTTSSGKKMTVSFGVTLSQPNTIFNLGSNNFLTGGGYVMDGIASGNRHVISALSSTQMYINAGSSLTLNYSPNSNTQRLLYNRFNTTSSSIAVNNGTTSNGNVGTQPLTGIIINASYTNNNSSTLNHQQELIIWNADKSSDRTGISNNINSYYSTY